MVRFRVSAQVPANEWAAIGFSDDTAMVSYMVCSTYTSYVCTCVRVYVLTYLKMRLLINDAVVAHSCVDTDSKISFDEQYVHNCW